MNKKHLFFAALFLAALAFGFVGCENPGDLLNNGDDSSITDNDSTTNNPNQGGNLPDSLALPTMVATRGATDVGYSTVTLWGRINTDTLWAFNNIRWGIECSTSKEEMQSHKGKKALCTTDLVGENSDEYTVDFTEVGYGKILYYNAYLLINNMKYIYGKVDSVQMLVRLTANPNNNEYGTVSGSGNYELGSEVTITATPKENYSLEGWGDCDSKELVRTIKLTSPDTTIVANFKLYPRLTVQSNNADYGTVTGSGLYEKGSEVTITATPKQYFKFVKWSDGNTENPRIVNLNDDLSLIAEFDHLCVDLGLSVRWATCNVGATKPEEYGNYYAWGEVEPKTSYSWSTYKWCGGTYTSLTKYNNKDTHGIVDYKGVLDPEDDAAVVNMGGEWRMPTNTELKELKTKCTWTWTTLNGVNGYNVEGPNGNSIFLPAAGYRDGSDLYGAGSGGRYWSSSLSGYGMIYAECCYFFSNEVGVYDSNRYCGFSVRGVCP